MTQALTFAAYAAFFVTKPVSAAPLYHLKTILGFDITDAPAWCVVRHRRAGIVARNFA
jgi:hypothetical protein